MFTILPESSGKVLGIRISGKLLHADYQGFVPQLEALIQQHGSARCLVEMVDFRGVEPRAIWDELKFDTKHCREIERCAVVGDRAWEKWMTNLSKPFFYKAELRYFDSADIDQAWSWIRQGS